VDCDGNPAGVEATFLDSARDDRARRNCDREQIVISRVIIEAGVQTVRRFLLVLALVGWSSMGKAGIVPRLDETNVRIPDLVSRSSFACKGEVISAPLVRNINAPLPRLTGVTTVRIDGCFKGALRGLVRVASDEYLPAGGWSGGGHIFIPEIGEYLLLFLKQEGELYTLVDQNRGALPVSRRLSPASNSGDPLSELEDDFKSGLNDSDHEVVLKSICWLGQLGRLKSTEELHALFDKGDPVEREYLWEALLLVGDLSVVQKVANDVDQHPPVFRMLSLPRDRLLLMQNRVFDAFCALRGPVVIPFLEHFTESSDTHIRVQALMALREIGDIHSSPVFLRALDDPQNDMNFIAMQSLFELAGGGAIDWVPSFEELSKHPDFYAAKCREWWITEGEAKATVRAATKLK
jgi:hypothetical protein